MSPITIPTIDDFAISEFGDEWELFSTEDKITYIQSEYSKNAYESYIETVSDYKSFTPIRLDQHPEQYKPTHHPAHHLHIGYENDSRIPVKRVLTPLAFTSFVLSTFYPKGWIKLHDDGHMDVDTVRSLKISLPMVNHERQEIWDQELEEKRLYLG